MTRSPLKFRRGVVLAALAFFFSSTSSASSIVADVSCTAERLKELSTKRRDRPWVCVGAKLGFIDDAPWDAWTLDNPEAFKTCMYKVLKPLAAPQSDSVVWTTDMLVNQHARLFHQYDQNEVDSTARNWLRDNVLPGMAVTIERLDEPGVVPEIPKFLDTFLTTFGRLGSLDLYASHVGSQGPVGSYGWHTDFVDTLIYVLNGRKRFRVAGFYPGSEVVLDRELGPGSIVYVPGGRFHHAMALEGDETGSAQGWARILSVGLPNPNEDLLTVRVKKLRDRLEGKGFVWNDQVSLRRILPRKLPVDPVNFADPEAYDSDGHTALHRRLLQGELSFAELLLHTGADTETLTIATHREGSEHDRRHTAMGLALCCGPIGVLRASVELLLKFGASTQQVERRKGKIKCARKAAQDRGVLGALDDLLPATRKDV